MVVASIDLQGGKVVQLKQGAELVLQRDNAAELAEEFNRYGEVAVIDLDAAMGKGGNLEMMKPLFRKCECRVGGGIRSAEQAKELVSWGASKIIVGSKAFRNDDGSFGVNRAFLENIAKKIGRERLIVAVDAKKGNSGEYEIIVDGWKTPTGLPLAESAKAVAEFSGDLLFTCVDREGTMTGMDLSPVKALRESVNCRLTAAGGVSSIEEIAALAELGCDVQLGMALYTGKVNLADAFAASLNWKKGEIPQAQNQVPGPKCQVPFTLLPVIAQSTDGQVMMTGYADREAVAESFRRGNLCFHSRTRDKLWMKGENSGNVLRIKTMRADCDRDAILAVVEPAGPVCHTGDYSCFGVNRRYTWEYLQSIIADRFRNPKPGSYTATLDDSLVREKVLEEAEEVCAAKTRDEAVWEAADLLYFLTALMTREKVTCEEVLAELDRRHKK
jgi:phosphoribosyl-ATP pyrophosphohydrolase/phosphoribosyl-AMP cyclohydrolase